LILASASPRRRELLTRVGIAVRIEPAEVDETPRPGEAPHAYVQRVAAAKADSVAAHHRAAWVLAADTAVVLDQVILGKAGDAAEALAMLERLNGRQHEVCTGFALRGPEGRRHDQVVATTVHLRRAGAAELEEYVAAGEWRGKAGAYAIQGMAAGLVEAVHGSVTNVIGLPLAEVLQTLTGFGVARPVYRRGVPA
jgi:septum formation protein